MAQKPYPKFSSEADEIAWLNAIGSGVDAYMGEPSPEARAAFDAAMQPPGDPPRKMISLRMPLRELARAKALARELNMGYQTFVVQLVTEGLEVHMARRKARGGAAKSNSLTRDPLMAEMGQEIQDIKALLGQIASVVGANAVEPRTTPKTRRKSAASG